MSSGSARESVRTAAPAAKSPKTPSPPGSHPDRTSSPGSSGSPPAAGATPAIANTQPRPQAKMATIKSEVATGRRINGLEGLKELMDVPLHSYCDHGCHGCPVLNQPPP